MDNEKIIKDILHLLSKKSVNYDEMGHTFLEIKDLLKNIEARKLKQILIDMEDKNLIEERHFADGRVDYSIENKGLDLIKVRK
ncbi:MAG: hypothetical protein U1B79_01275 [Candidatus Pacearchaeota archaeon]|nr:hypothetical protein [Nanoarchaeota archaeon]MDZ4226722.1 hypothetical protein [Candidatus Pacearchaeota archaeon]